MHKLILQFFFVNFTYYIGLKVAKIFCIFYKIQLYLLQIIQWQIRICCCGILQKRNSSMYKTLLKNSPNILVSKLPKYFVFFTKYSYIYCKLYNDKFAFAVVVFYKSEIVQCTKHFWKIHLIYWSHSCQNILYFLQKTVLFIANHTMINSHLQLWYFTKVK